MFKPLLLILAVMLCGFSTLPHPVNSSTSTSDPESRTDSTQQSQDPAPLVSTSAKNPVTPTPESQARAKKVYGYDCEMCHGATGNGKTDLATSMQLKISDWTDPKALATQTDGELYNIIKSGKDKMPPEGDRAKADDIWNLVIYVRSLAPAQTSAAKPSE